MPDNFSLNDLFKLGLNKEQFKAGFVAGKENDSFNEIYSLFGENIKDVGENIFDEIDTDKNGTIDEIDITYIKNKFKDNNQEDISENDLKTLAIESAIKMYGTKKPAQMFKNVMSFGGDMRESNYIPTLDAQIQTLEDLITQRKFLSENKINSYQDEIDSLVKNCAKDKKYNDSQYIKYSENIKTLRSDTASNSLELDAKKRELENAKNEKILLEKELAQLQKDPDKNKTEIEGLQFDIKIKTDLISTLTGEVSNLTEITSSLSDKIGEYSSYNEKIQKNIIANDAETKNKIKELHTRIRVEQKNAERDINNYKNELDILNNARKYALEEFAKQQESFANSPVPSDYSNTGANCPSLKDVNYSAEKGKKLAEYMRNHAVGFTGYCSRHVSNGIAATGLGNERAPSAHMMDGLLTKNSNFKEITVSSKEELKNLPAGCIIVYEAGAAGYNRKHGHIEVTLGNGTNCSDGITRNPRYAPPGQMHVFVPVA